MQTAREHGNGRAAVTAWRRDRLAAAGFALPVATRLARDGRYDLHRLIELVESGCPPELAAQILRPCAGDGAAA